MAGAILRLASTSVPICFSMIFVLSRRSTTFRVATARHATKSVELNERVMIATIFQRTSRHARRKARRARGQLRGHVALALSPVSFGNVQSPDAGIGLSEGSRVAVLRSLRSDLLRV